MLTFIPKNIPPLCIIDIVRSILHTFALLKHSSRQICTYKGLKVTISQWFFRGLTIKLLLS